MLPMLCNCEEQKPVFEAKEKFDSSINKVAFSHKHSSRHYFSSNIVVTKTETGALAKYDNYSQAEFSKGSEKSWKAEFSAKEWQNFIRALHNLRFNEWQKEYKDPKNRSDIERILEGDSKWSLNIFSPDKKEANTFSGENAYPPNWEELAKIMENVSEKIIVKTKKEAELPLENKLKMEYEKKFGEPISEFELSIRGVDLDTYGVTSVDRTETGAEAYYFLAKEGRERITLKLTTEEWLDFIRTLRKCQVDEWKEEAIDYSRAQKLWRFKIFFVDGKKTIEGYYDTPLPNWKEFKKTMDKMQARIKAEPARKKAGR